MSFPNALYIQKMNAVIAHWSQVDNALAPKTLILRLLEKDVPMTRQQFITLRDTYQNQLNTVEGCLAAQQLARSDINIKKASLLAYFNQFTSLVDGYFRNTRFYDLRPYAPSIGDGQLVFSRPMVKMFQAWAKINEGPAPASVTLPLVLENNMSQGSFASVVSSLQFDYALEMLKEQDVILARGDRDRFQVTAYGVMKTYREVLPGKIPQLPVLVETMPRLTPLPGHTPAPVNASAIFMDPNASKVIYDASTDATLHSYQLRGNVGDHYSDEDAMVIATHGPNDPREFITTFGLNQPGAQVAFKVYVILTTDNEAGSASLLVERPAGQQLAA